jgi:hypothetical protein
MKSVKLINSKIEKAKKNMSSVMLKSYKKYLVNKYLTQEEQSKVLNMIKSAKMKKNMTTGGTGAGLVTPAMGTANIPKKKITQVAIGKIKPVKKGIKIETGKEYIDRGANAASKSKIEAGYPQGQSKGMPQNPAGRKKDYLTRGDSESHKAEIERGYPQGVSHGMPLNKKVVTPKK